MKTFLLLCISLFLLSLTTARAAFICNSTATATCQSLAGYIPANATTLSALQSLFQVPSLPSLLGANNLPPTTPSSYQIPANKTVLIPFPCRCSNGTGVSDHVPIYTVKPTDQGLYYIATTIFDGFAVYQDIAKVNNITNVNVINPGQKLWIPLPCSCDPVNGEKAVHLAHIVAAGSSVEAIAEEFGTKEDVLLRLNGISDPKTLKAGQVLDVPLKACASSINSTSLDHDLLLPNNTYAITAENCIQCSCSSSNYQLSCHPIQDLSKSNSKCPVSKCGKLFIGNSTTDGCNLTTCAYEGYTNSTGLKILSNLVSRSTCNSGNGPAAQPAGSPPPSAAQPAGNAPPSAAQPAGNPPPSAAGRLRLAGYQIELLLLLQVALVWFCFWT